MLSPVNLLLAVQVLSFVSPPLPLRQNSSSWVLNDLAAVYWRVMGNGEMAVRCLKVALQHAPAKYGECEGA